jgi:hypothetical protein
MPILRERIAWSRATPPDKTRTSSDLTPDEQRHVKAALAFLVRRHGSYAKLATVAGTKRATLVLAGGKRGTVSAGIALRVARAAKVPLEDILSGAWPKPGACPTCGRSAEHDERGKP